MTLYTIYYYNIIIMWTIFNISKLVFFTLTVLIGMFTLSWEQAINAETYKLSLKIILPAYMVFSGIMLWYIIWYLLSLKKNKENDEQSFKIWFIIGWILWAIMGSIFFYFSK